MDRLTIDQVMMESAKIWARRSTCLRMQAGCVIAIDKHVVSTGYNGVPSGQQHCADAMLDIYESMPQLHSWSEWKETEFFSKEHHDWSMQHELHAESNAIIFAARRGFAILGATLYTTHSPCLQCTKAILQAGIKRVVYEKLYDRPEGLKSIEILTANGIRTDQL